MLKLNAATEKDRFRLARITLSVVAGFFVLGGLAQLFGGKPGEKIFDVCISILPPIATLIIGYYFGERSRA